MKTKRRRVFALFMSMVMAFSLVGALPVAVNAATPEAIIVERWLSGRENSDWEWFDPSVPSVIPLDYHSVALTIRVRYDNGVLRYLSREAGDDLVISSGGISCDHIDYYPDGLWWINICLLNGNRTVLLEARVVSMPPVQITINLTAPPPEPNILDGWGWHDRTVPQGYYVGFGGAVTNVNAPFGWFPRDMHTGGPVITAIDSAGGTLVVTSETYWSWPRYGFRASVRIADDTPPGIAAVTISWAGATDSFTFTVTDETPVPTHAHIHFYPLPGPTDWYWEGDYDLRTAYANPGDRLLLQTGAQDQFGRWMDGSIFTMTGGIAGDEIIETPPGGGITDPGGAFLHTLILSPTNTARTITISVTHPDNPHFLAVGTVNVSGEPPVAGEPVSISVWGHHGTPSNIIATNWWEWLTIYVHCENGTRRPFGIDDDVQMVGVVPRFTRLSVPVYGDGRWRLDINPFSGSITIHLRARAGSVTEYFTVHIPSSMAPNAHVPNELRVTPQSNRRQLPGGVYQFEVAVRNDSGAYFYDGGPPFAYGYSLYDVGNELSDLTITATNAAGDTFNIQAELAYPTWFKIANVSVPIGSNVTPGVVTVNISWEGATYEFTFEVAEPTPTPNGPTLPPTPPPEEPPIEVTIGDIEVSIEVEDEQVILELTEENIADIVAEALDTGDETVVIDLSDLPEDVVSAVLPGEAWASLGEAGLGLELAMPAGTLSFDADALLSVGEFADGGEVVSTIYMPETAGLTAAQQNVVREDDIVLRITLTVDGEYITNLGGELAVTVPFDGPLPVNVWRVTAAGTLELLNSWVNEDGTVTFVTAGLSVFVLGSPMQIMRFAIGSIFFSYRDTFLTLEAAPFIDTAAGRTMVPIRAIAEGLGATVRWHRDPRTVIITRNGTSITLLLDTPLPDGMGMPVVLNGRTFVPLRYVSEMLGANVRLDRENSAVYVYE